MRRVIAVILSFAAIGAYWQAGAQTKTSGTDGFQFVDKTGNIRKPANVRDTYQSLGAFTVLDPKGNQMHFTYATPGTAEAYRRTGKFPDGTVLVKEVFGTEHAQMTTGDANWASGTKVWFVLIKDAKGATPEIHFGAMGGVGHSLRPTHLTSRWRPTTKKTALAVISPLSRQTGSTYKAIRFSNQNEEGYRRKA